MSAGPTPPEPQAPSPSGDRLAVIAGSGLRGANLSADAKAIDRTVTGADGTDQFVTLEDCGHFVLLQRHDSIAPHVAPHRLDHHANIRAVCEAGCSRVLALSSVGSLRRDWGVGTVVAPDDFLALYATPTFYDDIRGHGVPGFDEDWRQQVVAAWGQATGTAPIDGGVYAQTRGPRFETPAEIRFLADYADLVGMTVASESVLAGEAGLAYAAVCKVDNLGNGLDTEPLTLAEFQANTAATLGDFVNAVRSTVEILGAQP